jgi:hypothetical protein
MATQEELEQICPNASLIDFGDDEAISCVACHGITDPWEIFPEGYACRANIFSTKPSEDHPIYHAEHNTKEMYKCLSRNKN